MEIIHIGWRYSRMKSLDWDRGFMKYMSIGLAA